MKEKIIELVIKEAKKALINDDVPVGAVIEKNGEILGVGHNQRVEKNDVSMHAEIVAIKKTSKKLKNWKLCDCNIYVSLMPCVMCAGAITQARIKNVYYFAERDKDSFLVQDIFERNETGTKVNYWKIDDGGKSANLLRDYFKTKRKKGENREII